MDPNPPVWVMFAPYDDASASECLILARAVRSWGIPTEVDGRAVRLRKKLERGADMQCYYVIILGPSDIEKNTAQVRDVDESRGIGKAVLYEVPLDDLDGWLAERLLGYQQLREAKFQREQATDELSTRVTAAIVAAERADDPALWDAVAQLEASLVSVTQPGSVERKCARRGVGTAQATAARLRAG